MNRDPLEFDSHPFCVSGSNRRPFVMQRRNEKMGKECAEVHKNHQSVTNVSNITPYDLTCLDQSLPHCVHRLLLLVYGHLMNDFDVIVAP